MQVRTLLVVSNGKFSSTDLLKNTKKHILALVIAYSRSNMGWISFYHFLCSSLETLLCVWASSSDLFSFLLREVPIAASWRGASQHCWAEALSLALVVARRMPCASWVCSGCAHPWALWKEGCDDLGWVRPLGPALELGVEFISPASTIWLLYNMREGRKFPLNFRWASQLLQWDCL